MTLLGLGPYVAFAVIGSRELRRFATTRETPTTAAHLAALALNCGGALLNPLGQRQFRRLEGRLTVTYAGDAIPGMAITIAAVRGAAL